VVDLLLHKQMELRLASSSSRSGGVAGRGRPRSVLMGDTTRVQARDALEGHWLCRRRGSGHGKLRSRLKQWRRDGSGLRVSVHFEDRERSGDGEYRPSWISIF